MLQTTVSIYPIRFYVPVSQSTK